MLRLADTEVSARVETERGRLEDPAWSRVPVQDQCGGRQRDQIRDKDRELTALVPEQVNPVPLLALSVGSRLTDRSSRFYLRSIPRSLAMPWIFIARSSSMSRS